MNPLRFFTLDEFNCSCCGQNLMDRNFLTSLDTARGMAGIPFVITSGFRCAKHNGEVGGVFTSAHLIGKAADIAAGDSRTRYQILMACSRVGITRFEIGPAHVHVDRDASKWPWVIDLVSAHKGGV